MKPEIKAAWLEALRSGRYKQGTGQLHNDQDQYCCLGVLCDLHSKATGQPWSGQRGTVYLGQLAMPPAMILNWAGMPSSLVTFERASRSLDDLNDSGRTFQEIADLIEAQL